MGERIKIEPRKTQGRVAESGGKSALQYIEEALNGLQFGTVAIVVQDGVIVQVERTEKMRFGRG